MHGPMNGELGTKVRLHIDGLGSPMRARVKDAKSRELTVGSELGFLQVGKQLELEDAATGGKRPARIDRVEVEIDPSSKVPQLVVTLRYDDDTSDAPPPNEDAAAMPGLFGCQKWLPGATLHRSGHLRASIPVQPRS